MTGFAVVFLLVLAGTCAGTAVPSRWLPRWLPNDKLLHAAAYCALSLLALAGLGLTTADWLPVGLGLFALGLLLECVQIAVPGRGFSLGDVAANTAGIAGGLTLHALAASL